MFEPIFENTIKQGIWHQIPLRVAFTPEEFAYIRWRGKIMDNGQWKFIGQINDGDVFKVACTVVNKDIRRHLLMTLPQIYVI